MKKLVNLFCLLVLLLAWTSTSNAITPEAKVTAKVISEDGTPIDNATVKVWTQVLATSGKMGLKSISVEGVSDSDGLFTASNDNAVQQVTIWATKDGYYKSSRIYKFESRSYAFNRWEPWNPTIEVVLKEKRNPIPMYAQSTEYIQIPVVGKPVGFDLEQGDWVAPYGKGVISDFVFTYDIDLRAYRDYEASLLLAFTNKSDGIQEYLPKDGDPSYYKWPFEAPIDGYQSTLRKEKIDTPEKGLYSNFKRNIDYIFRVRTKMDEKGNIVEAKYGKISGEFEIGRKALIKLNYWFNPTGSRNLEFDPKQNLFTWPSRDETRHHHLESP